MDCGRMIFRAGEWTGWLMVAIGIAAQPALSVAQDKSPNQSSAVKLDSTGLSLAPSQAAFYSSSLNLRAACLKEIESGFIGQVRQTSYGQRLEAFLKDKWDNPEPQAEQVKRMLNGPIARDIIKLLSDMSARECFMFGDANWTEFLEAFVQLQYDMAGLNGQDPAAMREHFLGLDREYFDSIQMPTTVIGFQLSEDEIARTQLDAFEGILRLALGNAEQLKEFAKKLKRVDLSNGQTLSMTFSADDIPWDSLPVENDEAQELVDHLSDMISGRKIVLSVGVLDNRLLVSIGERADTLTTLGKGDKLLSTPAIQQLVKNPPANLRMIQYSSGDFRMASLQTNFGHYFERLALQVTTPLAQQFDSDEFEEWREKLLEDCEWLDDKMSEALPKYAAMLAYSFETPEGTESYAYDWTPSWILENAKPLAVASHAGTSPLLLLATRQKWLKGISEIVDATLDELPNHVEALVESGMLEDDQAEKLEEGAEKILPIIEDIYAALRDKVVGGMDGNESVTSFAAQSIARQLNEYAPPPPAPLPLPEVSVAVKIKNRDLFLSGCDEVIQGINALMDVIRQENPGNIPPGARVPEAREESLADGGKRYSFPLGAPAPWDQFEIQMALNKEVAVLGYSTRQVKDMYQSRPLAARPEWYSADQPVAAVGYMDIAGIFKAIKPWVHYGLVNSNEDLDQPLAPGGEAPVPSGSEILEIWDCFSKLGQLAGTTMVDKNNVSVSHWIWVGE